MKVFWLLLFGICTLPIATSGFYDFRRCRNGITVIQAKEYCITKIFENGSHCDVAYGTANKIDVAPESAWGERGCDMQMDGIIYCYCNGWSYCNSDIVYFHDLLIDAANRNTEDPHLKKRPNCIRPALKRECAVGKPEGMVLEKRIEENHCVITLKKDQETYKVVNLGQEFGAGSAVVARCHVIDDFVTCYCIEHQCNIQVDAITKDDVILGMNYDRRDLADLAVAQLSSFASGVRVCGDSVAVYDPNGTKSCAVVFKKNESGEYTSELSLVDKDQKGCFTTETEFDGNVVTCICKDDSCEVKELLAGLSMKLNGDGCVQEAKTTLQTTSIPTTSTPTTSTPVASTSTSTTTMTTTTTTAPEQLTCWASDLSKVTKDKTNSVCFIDYAMINSRCELRGKGIDEEKNAIPGCLVIDGTTLRCKCVEDGCNKQLDDMWNKAVFNNTETFVLIEYVDRLVNRDTLPTTGTSPVTPNPTSLYQTEDAKSSSYFGLFIGSVAFNVLLVVTVLALVVALVKLKKKKGGEAKQGTAKPEKKTQQTPTAITIEKPVVSKESSTVPPTARPTKSAEQNEAPADKTTTGTGTLDLDTTGGTSDSDSTGPEAPSEVRWTVSGFNRD